MYMYMHVYVQLPSACAYSARKLCLRVRKLPSRSTTGLKLGCSYLRSIHGPIDTPLRHLTPPPYIIAQLVVGYIEGRREERTARKESYPDYREFMWSTTFETRPDWPADSAPSG